MATKKYTRIVLNNFSNGLVTDIIGYPDSLLEATNVMIDRAGEVACRGPKPSVFSTTGVAPSVNRPAAIGFIQDKGMIITGVTASATATTAVNVVTRSDSTASNSNTNHGSAVNFGNGDVMTPMKNVVEWFPHGPEMIGYDPDSGLAFRWGGSQLFGFGSTATLCMGGAPFTGGNGGFGSGTPVVREPQSGSAITAINSTAVEPNMYLSFNATGTNLSGVVASTAQSIWKNTYRITDVRYSQLRHMRLEGQPFSGATGVSSTSASVANWNVSPIALLTCDPDVFNPVISEFTALGTTATVYPTATYMTSPTGAFSATTATDTGVRWYTNAKAYCSHKDRVFAGGTRDGFVSTQQHGSRLRWSAKFRESNGIYHGATNWHANGFQDIYPGVGGNIVCMRSMGDELIVLKNRAMFACRGNVETDGTLVGFSIDMISDELGCNNVLAACVTRIGLVVANRLGLWVYDQTGPPKNILKNRLQRWWRENMTAGGARHEYVVSSLGTRIVITGRNGATNADQHSGILVYDIDKDNFTTQTINGIWGKIINCPFKLSTEEGYLSYSNIGTAPGAYNWNGDFDIAATGLHEGPFRMSTQPIDLGYDPIGQGRVKSVYVNGYTTDVASARNPTLKVLATYGRSTSVSGDTSGLYLAPEGTSATDNSVKVPMTGSGHGMKAESAIKITIESADASGNQDLLPGDTRVFGIALDVERPEVNYEV